MMSWRKHFFSNSNSEMLKDLHFEPNSSHFILHSMRLMLLCSSRIPEIKRWSRDLASAWKEAGGTFDFFPDFLVVCVPSFFGWSEISFNKCDYTILRIKVSDNKFNWCICWITHLWPILRLIFKFPKLSILVQVCLCST